MSDSRKAAPGKPEAGQDRAEGNSRREIEARLAMLAAQARYGAWGLAAFVLISVLAIPDLVFRPALPGQVAKFLGAAPDVSLISLALVVYVFSALTLTLARIMQGSGRYKGWSHLFFIGAFYVFYTFAGAIRDFYWAIFVSGLVILGLENYSIRTYCREAAEEEQERLETL